MDLIEKYFFLFDLYLVPYRGILRTINKRIDNKYLKTCFKSNMQLWLLLKPAHPLTKIFFQ